MNNLVIPHIKLSKSEILEISEILSTSNEILKSYHAKMAIRKGRKGYRDEEGNSFSKIDLVNLIYEKRKLKELNLKGVLIDSEDVKRICEIKEKEYLILSNYSHLFYKLSKKYYFSNSSYEMEDLQNECIAACLKAIYGYSQIKKGVKVSLFTFLYTSISNHLRKLNDNMLSSLGNRAAKIKQKFIEFKVQNPNLTFDDIVQELNFSFKELEILNCCLNSNVFLESDQKENQSENIENMIASEEFIEKVEIEPKSLRVIDNVIRELSDLEKEVLRGYLDTEKTSKKYNFGIGKYAKNLINPKTKKPYSKMAISYAWKRVQEKIKKAA